jgi:DNA-formamidopyrimidine glycosylase
MPEGPEILITSQYLGTKLKNKKIQSIDILSGRYTHQKLKGLTLVDNFPHTVLKVDSKGKFLWFHMVDNNNKSIYMLCTFGLTGRWSFHKEKNSRIHFAVQSTTNAKKKYDLYYIDDRNFGTVEFTDNTRILDAKLDRLAPDVLKSNQTDDLMINTIKKYTLKKDGKNIVKVLMDQEAVVSGIGNYLVAEILYDAKIDPHRNIGDLSDREIEHLAMSIRKITKHAYYHNTSGYMTYFEKFMKKHADRIDSGVYPNYHPDIKIKQPFEFKVYQQKKDPLGNKVQNDEIIKGRTIHWVEQIQK